MREWRTVHPKASFAELEVAVEERLGRLRVRPLEDAALSSVGETEAGALAGAACPECGSASGGLVSRGGGHAASPSRAIRRCGWSLVSGYAAARSATVSVSGAGKGRSQSQLR